MLSVSLYINQKADNINITYFAVLQSNNKGLISKDCFAHIDGTFAEIVVPDGTDFRKLTATIYFNGKYILKEDGVWIEKNNPNWIVNYQNQILEVFDAAGHSVIYNVHFVFESDQYTEIKTFTLLNDSGSKINNIPCYISKNMITAYVPDDFNDFDLTVLYKTPGEKVVCNGKALESGVSKLNFSKPLKMEVYGKDGDVFEYTVSVSHVAPNLQSVFINCKSRIEKDGLSDATIEIKDQSETLLRKNIKIKVRGNSTAVLIKKGYKVIFDEEVSASQGFARSKYLIFLANATDVTMQRHAIAFETWKSILNAEGFTTQYKYVNMFMNDKYAGTYMMLEQLEVCAGKIEPGVVHFNGETYNGFALEVDLNVATSKTVSTENGLAYSLLNYDDFTDGRRKQIHKLIQTIENSIYDQTFMDCEYINVDSFVNWWIINNFAKNTEATKMVSTFMYIDDSGRLTAGPIWDFDRGFGGSRYGELYDGFVGTKNLWMSHMINDERFMSLVRSRWKEISGTLTEKTLSFINGNYSAIKPSMEQNCYVWNGCDDFDARIAEQKLWIENRVKWLDEQWG